MANLPPETLKQTIDQRQTLGEVLLGRRINSIEDLFAVAAPRQQQEDWVARQRSMNGVAKVQNHMDALNRIENEKTRHQLVPVVHRAIRRPKARTTDEPEVETRNITLGEL